MPGNHLMNAVKTMNCLAVSMALMACAGAARSAEPIDILPGDERFKAPAYEDFEVRYGSTFSKNGEFTLQVRNVAGGTKTHVMDIIPGENAVVVAFRMIDSASQRVEFSAGPYFAWGQEFVVNQASNEGYDAVRIPIGGGEPARMTGELPLGGSIADTFSPTLASLMPMQTGAKFRLPIVEPRKDETFANVFANFEVVGREELILKSGLRCECWVIEGTTSAMTSRYWVSREAPFFYRWHRDIGGQREFISEALGFRLLQ